VTLEVTLTIVPARRARIWGMTAWHIAITPIVLVSKSWRTSAMGVASKAPTAPMPALFTNTSICPAASINDAMLAAFVTSSGSTRNWRVSPSNAAASGGASSR
jgi:hypothetical protein